MFLAAKQACVFKMYDPQLIFPCVQYGDTTVVGLAIKILSRKHMGLTQF